MDLKKTSLAIVRHLTGALYVFAGFVKLVDPVGAQIKLKDYFEAFGLDFLVPIAMLVGVLAALLEFFLGWALILNLFKKISVSVVFGLSAFFTVLTLFLALNNPVSDCGCFGDALKLTNWETFYKNVVLMAFVTFIFVNRNAYNRFHSLKKQWYYSVLVVILGAAIAHMSYYHLPLIDFRPFAVGNHIPTLMQVPAGAPADEYKTVFYYSKNNETKQFSEENYPWQDSTWTFVEMTSELIKKGYEPPIHDFVIDELGRGNITNELLNNKGEEYLLVASKLEEIKNKDYDRIFRVAEWLDRHDRVLTVITASSDDALKKFQNKMGIPMVLAKADETMLKTIIRSKPGLVVLKDGVIIEKYAIRDFPQEQELKNPLANALQNARYRKSKLKILYLFLIFAIGLFVPIRFNVLK